MNIHDLEPDEILFAGDWHGYLGQAQAAINLALKKQIKHIIVLGDFGFWNDHATRRFITGLDDLLTEHDIYVFWVDGNHEDFPYLFTYPLAPDGTRPITERIIHLPRGLRFNWLGVDFLAFGGAYSIDRKFRDQGRTFFDEECATPDEVAQAVAPGQTDILLMHDSPAGAPNDVVDSPLGQHNAARFYGIDHLNAANNHRNILAPLLDTNPVLTLHGHYHDRWFKHYVLPSGQKSGIMCLDEGSTGVARNTISYTLSELQVIINEYRNTND